ncbi:predicted protein [Nematostella vectensis]|uniref:F5/8 type C domain-containing protein n=1 Tax=Nematostella vectensis TaxID=45351 RepID=A7RK10_NEMVE|nr:predicted protein [Nematostella vectensis]|eukprot:XP_001640141.1 predicted protein [Nematostella vectensis]
MPLGLESHFIPSENIRTNSMWNHNHGPDRGILNQRNTHGRTGAWIPRSGNRKYWILYDLGRKATIKGIATQGRYEANQWVKSYRIKYSADGKRWHIYKSMVRYTSDNLRSLRTFRGNYDRMSIVSYRLSPPIKARYISIHPMSWYNNIALRVELYGCFHGKGMPNNR